ncbi:hypothetical protein OH491_23920 [Termitidicoccus mucosus]|uniref:Uncharacterized protein n=1 Tax=Termitidicoccus mucosus TaxID=1184151 RepID=A0A178IP37_9BACT|nr:hypothetical protein AW736_02575 [Opitutaceae bacterium TSB47]
MSDAASDDTAVESVSREKLSSSAPRKAEAHGVLFTYAYALKVTLASLVLFLFSLGGNVVLFLLLFLRADQAPWVVMPDAEGRLKSTGVSRYEVTPDTVYSFLSHVIPRLYFISEGEPRGLDSIEGLVDEVIISKERASVRRAYPKMKDAGVEWQAQTLRLLAGTPEARTFVISTRVNKVRAMVEGRTTIVSRIRNTGEPVRWDVELDIIAPTSKNPWGLRLVSIFVNGVDAPPIAIEDLYFK